MKKAYWQDSKKMFKNNLFRFISIVVIIMLGSMFFIGMNSVAPVIKQTAEDFMQDKNVYDISFTSVFGYSEEDLKLFKENEHVKEVCGVYSFDALTKFDDTEISSRLCSLMDKTDMNQSEIIEGRNISSDNECLISTRLQYMYNYNIGDKIRFYLNDGTDLNELLDYTEFTIVGVVRNPIYLSKLYGNTSLLTGELNSYVFIKENVFNLNNYSLLFLKTDVDNSIPKFSDEYEEKISNVLLDLEKIDATILSKKYTEFYDSSMVNIGNYYQQIKNAKNYFIEQFNNIYDAQMQVNSAISNFAYSVASSYNYPALYEIVSEKNKTLNDLYYLAQDLTLKKNDLENSCDDILFELKSFEKELDALDNSISKKLYAIYTLKDNDAEFINLSKELSKVSFNYNLKLNDFSVLNDSYVFKKSELDETQKKLEEIEKEIESLQSEMQSTFNSLNDLASGTNNRKLIATAQKIEASQSEIDTASTELNNLIEEVDLNDKYNQLNGLKNSLINFNPSIDNTPLYKNRGFTSLKNDLDKIAIMGKIFPVMFFVVAALVTITTTTRMIEEDRKNLGTLKALGYKRKTIIFKYIIYSLATSLLGTILGTLLGSLVIVNILYTSYGSLYDLPPANLSINILLTIIALIISLIATVFITLIITSKVLKENTAQLMRPKAVKEGKNIFLEKIPFLWKNLSFLSKISFRNIFRYKRRLFMTVIGIAGCTALIYAGLSLQSSINTIASRQFSKVRKLSMEIYLKQNASLDDINSILVFVNEKTYIKSSLPVNQNSFTVEANDKTKNVFFTAADGEKLSEYLSFNKRKTNEFTKLDDSGVIITEKLSQILNVSVGDTIKLNDDSNSLNVKILGISENYLYNYVYFTPATYEKLYGKEISYNVIFTDFTKVLDNTEEIALSNELKENDKIASTIFENVLEDDFITSLGSLTTIVLLFIGCASLLSFTVLINLNNINIEERKRELATIKLLGFRKKELESYVFKENIILTFIGILFGLILGICIFGSIIQSAEVETIFLPKDINILNLFISSIITLGFTIITNLFMKKKLKSINMIDSLKSVE